MRRLVARAVAVLIAAGTMVAPGGVLFSASAAYQPNPTTSWVPDGTVFAVAKSGNKVYLGGAFTSLKNPVTGQTVERSRLAAVHADTGALLSWNPGADNTVRALAVGSDGTVYAGGAFTSAAGVAASRLAAIASTGSPVSGWKADANKAVHDIAVDSTGVFVAGAFGRINGAYRARVAHVSASTGALDKTFNARVAGGRVYSVSVFNNLLLLGGSFTSLSGKPRVFSGSVTRGSGSVTSWAPAAQCDTCTVLDLATDGSRVYEAIAGPGGRAVAFSLSSGGRVWSRYGDGDVQAIAVHRGVVYAGGHFSNVANLARRQLVSFDATRGSALSYQITVIGRDGPGVWAITVGDDALRLGGGFRLANSPAARYASFPTT